ncbi:hypothetical protein VTN49DRAFT_5718 [Thermomyces lanuginosus]|uniref:uncharacterized protein n=1 Tax=Thermomyces lanuginosus TaxID=5541 RepID=UPI003743D85A
MHFGSFTPTRLLYSISEEGTLVTMCFKGQWLFPISRRRSNGVGVSDILIEPSCEDLVGYYASSRIQFVTVLHIHDLHNLQGLLNV